MLWVWFWWHRCLLFFRFYAYFSTKNQQKTKKNQILAILKPYCSEWDLHKENTKCKWVCEMNRGIHCKSRTSFMGLAVNAGINIWNEKFSAFPHNFLQMLIPALTASPIKDVPDLQWKPLFISHSFAFSIFFMEISFTTVGFENGKNLKQIFEKNA